MRSFVCVTYTDDRSAGRCSIRDLQISAEQKTVGCSSVNLGRAKPGDIVLICAAGSPDRLFMFGELTEKIESCRAWADEGGEMWKYNFRFTPLTNILSYDSSLRKRVSDACKKHGVHNQVFNSRYAQRKHLAVVQEVFLS